MSTKTEREVAHDEKSKFVIFRPEIAYGRPRNVLGFFSYSADTFRDKALVAWVVLKPGIPETWKPGIPE